MPPKHVATLENFGEYNQKAGTRMSIEHLDNNIGTAISN